MQSLHSPATAPPIRAAGEFPTVIWWKSAPACSTAPPSTAARSVTRERSSPRPRQVSSPLSSRLTGRTAPTRLPVFCWPPMASCTAPPEAPALRATGVVYSLTSGGTETVLHDFSPLVADAITGSSNLDGANPYGALIEGTDGNLYGTALNGGTSGAGTLFQINAFVPFISGFSPSTAGVGAYVTISGTPSHRNQRGHIRVGNSDHVYRALRYPDPGPGSQQCDLGHGHDHDPARHGLPKRLHAGDNARAVPLHRRAQ